MAVFLKMDRGNAFSKSLNLELNAGLEARLSANSKYAYAIHGLDTSFLLDKEGKEVEEGIVKAGQRISINLGHAKADKYHVQLVVNPELAKAGYVGGPILLEPYEEMSLEYSFKAEKQLDFSRLSYLFRVYIVD